VDRPKQPASSLLNSCRTFSQSRSFSCRTFPHSSFVVASSTVPSVHSSRLHRALCPRPLCLTTMAILRCAPSATTILYCASSRAVPAAIPRRATIPHLPPSHLVYCGYGFHLVTTTRCHQEEVVTGAPMPRCTLGCCSTPGRSWLSATLCFKCFRRFR
jgi:hypothetical protein